MSPKGSNRVSAYLQKLFEGLKTLAGKGPGSLVIPEKSYGGKVYPDPTFQDMNKTLMGDPDIRSAIDFIADVITGNGFQVTMNQEYKTVTQDGRTAKEVVDDKCKFFGIDELLQEVSRDLTGYGNSFLWKKNPVKIETLARILPGTIQSFEFDEMALSLKAVQTESASYAADTIIPFCYNRIGRSPIGVGILQALCTAMSVEGGTRPAFAEIKNRIQKAMMEQIEKFSSYNELWVLPGLSDDKLKEYHTKIQTLKNARMAINKPDAKVLSLIPERMRGLDFYAEMIWNSFYLALGTPYPKLILGGGANFTEAAANAAMMMGERRVVSSQRYLKRMTETWIFDAWVKEEGLDPSKAQVRMNWQLGDKPKSEVLLPILEKTWELKGITTPEWRDILMGMGVNLEKKELETGATPAQSKTDETAGVQE
jgi:hypothetical protein